MTESADDLKDAAATLQLLWAEYDAAVKAEGLAGEGAGTSASVGAGAGAGTGTGTGAGFRAGGGGADTVDVAGRVVRALKTASHSVFSSDAERARADAVTDGIEQMVESLARLVDEHRTALRNSRTAIAGIRDELAAFEPAQRNRGKHAAWSKVDQDLADLEQALAKASAKQVGKMLTDAVGTGLRGLSQTVPVPGQAAGPGQLLPWIEDEVLLRTLHELVKAAFAAPGAFDEPIGVLKRQLKAHGIVVVETVTDDSAACFLFHLDDRLPAGAVRVDEPALARKTSGRDLVPLPGRKGLAHQGPFDIGPEVKL
ncbi:hypothetical protein ACFQ9X_28900 [Catenulispora yoronensis]